MIPSLIRVYLSMHAFFAILSDSFVRLQADGRNAIRVLEVFLSSIFAISLFDSCTSLGFCVSFSQSSLPNFEVDGMDEVLVSSDAGFVLL